MPEASTDPTARRLGPLAGLALPERHEVEGDVGITLEVPGPVSIVGVEARRGKSVTLSRRVKKAYGEMPKPNRGAGETVRLLHVAPDTLLCLAEDRAEGALHAELRELLGDAAAVVDQSHGRTLIRLGGPKARELLAFGTGIDLAPEVFGPGACAATMLGHVAVTLHLRSTAPTFDLIVARAFAESLWDWLKGRAGRFGYEVVG